MNALKYLTFAALISACTSSSLKTNTVVSGDFQDGSTDGRPASIPHPFNDHNNNHNAYGTLNGSGNVERTLLSYDTLMNGSDPGSRIDLSGYALPPEAAHPQHLFAGRLTLHGEASGGGFFEQVDTYNYTDNSDSPRKHLPEFDFQFVQTGSHIFPLQRGSIPSAHPDWEYVLAPGRVWRENGDKGYTRVSIPFALQERNANCVHNGVMSFLFKENGAISKVAYQISSETCLYFKADWWGLLSATYTPQDIADKARLIREYQEEIAARLPVKPLSTLADDYPGINTSAFAAPNDTDPTHVSTAGFVIDGIHYRADCTTRRGDYPFCESLVVPSYSAAKSLVAGVAMMRLEYLYPGVRNSLVGSYVPDCDKNGNWNDVTLDNLLDMASGNYSSSTYMQDEDAKHTDYFFLPETHANKIHYSCTRYSRKAPPGTQWVYHTSDTYIAGTLMNAYLRSRRGSDADLFTDIIVEDLWKPIGVSATGRYTRRTYDSVRQPFTGWGLIWLPDDIVKIASFIGIDRGKINGEQVLDANQLDAALQRSATDTGTVPMANYRYNNGFWAHNVAGKLSSCSGDLWIPFLSGFGGITVVLLPNNSIYYYFSDNDTYYWLEAVQEAHKIRSLCQ
ncbi:serine hydrolase [Microbulbifer thermotolerans]|uniref:serine hydrolase n=1 Tax=Microbulbifer thermotolerans TaxID=252514 RepID=UPI001E3D567A|nr:serine hydrolase domain-containing protein [Microbulbifer thermotolerans]